MLFFVLTILSLAKKRSSLPLSTSFFCVIIQHDILAFFRSKSGTEFRESDEVAAKRTTKCSRISRPAPNTPSGKRPLCSIFECPVAARHYHWCESCRQTSASRNDRRWSLVHGDAQDHHEQVPASWFQITVATTREI